MICLFVHAVQDWPEDLLAHELCEELVISAPTKEGEVINTVVFRFVPNTHIHTRTRTRSYTSAGQRGAQQVMCMDGGSGAMPMRGAAS
jgi:hypothetical protein